MSFNPHWILYDSNANLLDPNWNDNPASREAAKQHASDGGLVGIVPSSLGCFVIHTTTFKATKKWLNQRLIEPLCAYLTQQPDTGQYWFKGSIGVGDENVCPAPGIQFSLVSDGSPICLFGQQKELRTLSDALETSQSQTDQIRELIAATKKEIEADHHANAVADAAAFNEDEALATDAEPITNEIKNAPLVEEAPPVDVYDKPTGSEQGNKKTTRMPLPASLEAESAVLAALILHDDAWPGVLDTLKYTDFTTSKHRYVFEAITTLWERNESYDLVALQSYLTDVNKLNAVGGVEAIISIVESSSGSKTNAPKYANIIRDRATRRQLITAGMNITESGYRSENRPVEELIASAEEHISNAADRIISSRHTMHAGEAVELAFEEVKKFVNQPNRLPGVTTGLPTLDKFTQGLKPGSLTVLGGRPGLGKTALALLMAEAAAMEGYPVLFHSLEMTNEELATRLLSSMSRVSLRAIIDGQEEKLEDHTENILQTIETVRSLPLTFNDQPGITTSKLRLTARMEQRNWGGKTGIIFVDYIQLMRYHIRKENTNQEVTAITNDLKAIAKELKCPIVALSQLNRKGEEGPKLVHLRESGSIEQDADNILLLSQSENNGAYKERDLELAKQRNGPTGTFKLNYLSSITRFEDANIYTEFTGFPSEPNDKPDEF